MRKTLFPKAIVRVAICLGAALLCTAVLCMAEVRRFRPGFNMFSVDQDMQLGREAAQQVEKQYQVVSDPELQSYIDKIGQSLAAQPQAGKFPYTFKLVIDPSINAFALPGGPTFVHTGLIKAADNEAQLVGVMAHEISHCALRHGTNQASKQNLLQIPAALAGAVAGNSMLGQLSQLGMGLGMNSVFLKFSRGAETEADLNGAQMMAGAGYNPIEMARFFEKLEASGGQQMPQFLSSHPNPGNRMHAIESQLREMPARNYNTDTGRFSQVKAKVNGIPVPPPKAAAAAK
jgi:predicted Zn-dependent protease